MVYREWLSDSWLPQAQLHGVDKLKGCFKAKTFVKNAPTSRFKPNDTLKRLSSPLVQMLKCVEPKYHGPRYDHMPRY
jgi:hypothetical protein